MSHLRFYRICGNQDENHPFEWVSILGEEFGEFCEAVNESCFNTVHVKREKGGKAHIIEEAVQVAAVAVAIVEAMLSPAWEGKLDGGAA
jgi:imidazoleglycerol phosphate dehydratase HisB